MHRLDPKLQPFADSFAALQWAAMILDAEWRLAWVSDELKQFIRATPESDLGFGLHIAETLLKDTWRSAMTEASPGEIVRDLGGYLRRRGLGFVQRSSQLGALGRRVCADPRCTAVGSRRTEDSARAPAL
jgi:hypothetical protein